MAARLLASASTLLVATASAATLTTGSAHVPTDAADPLAAPAVGTQQATRSAPRVEQYWTAERMAKALPAPNPANAASPAPSSPPSTRSESGDGGGRAAVAPLSADGHQAPLAALGQSAVWENPSSAPATTIGKLYFTENGSRYWCSASVINSANHNTIWTAGHCVTKGNGTWNSNFLFVPNYYRGHWPFGFGAIAAMS